MQIDHYAMAILFAVASCFWIWRRQALAFGAALLSQAPFWIGSWVFFKTGETPIQVNMVTDLAASAAFVFFAYRFNEAWLIWLGVVFLSLGIADVYASWFGMSYYFQTHVAAHILALAIVLGRRHVNRVDRPFYNRRTRVADR